ncbi:MAG: restriction endonuclease subunit S [Flavobacteriales bacterium]|nr:restriction endonuclease subunit S [Flavobacteriales bacterium]
MRASYPTYKSTSIPWLPEMPEHWDALKAKHIFKERSEKGYPDEPLLAATQTKGVVRKEEYENRTVTAQKDFHLLKLVKEEDFVISLRSFQGGIEYAYHRGIISPAYTIFYERNKVAVNKAFYRHLFKSYPFINSLTLFVTGIREGQNIDYAEFKDSLLPFPPLPEQTAIANYLDAKTEQINRFIEKKEKLIALLKEQKQAVINELLEDKEGKWERMKLKFVSNVNKLSLGEKTNLEFEFTYLDISSVDEGGNQSETIQKIKFKDAPSRARRVVRKGDVIISTVRTYLQSITFFDSEVEDIIVSTGYAVLTPRQKTILPEFLNFAVRKKEVLDEIMANSTGITYPAITSIKLSNFKISVPSIDEQLEIIKQINTETNRILTVIGRIEREIEIVKELKQSLIAEVVTGRIKVA